MKIKETPPERLLKHCLPDAIFVCFEPFETDIKKEDLELVQNQSGRLLIRRMSKHFFESDEIKIFTEKNEKPEMLCDGIEISVSFSHTNDGVAGAISNQFNVGFDMEHMDRQVNPRLLDRMKHNDETTSFYKEIDAIRIWTLKESALKMIGTGLRKPMKSVQISFIDQNYFGVRFDDGRQAKICSFQHHHHWITVCYQELSSA